MEKTNVELSVPKSFQVVVGGKTYDIHKMHVGKYAQVLGAMESLPDKLHEIFPDRDIRSLAADLDADGMTSMLKALPKFMQYAFDEVCNIIAIATDIPVDDIMNDSDLGLDGLLDIVEKVAQLNNFAKVAGQIKKLMVLGRQ